MPAYRARVVYVAQRPALPEGQVDAALQVPFGFRAHRQQPYSANRARELLVLLGRDEKFRQQRTERLSGGEGQIVAMLRALLIAPDVLLLDEPTASLDAKNSAAVVSLINEAKARGAAIVGIFHDEAVRNQVADRLHPMGTPA